jgi:hypothetical protein
MIVLNVHASTEDKTDDTTDSCHNELERVIDKFLKHRMSLGDFSDKVDIEGIFKPTTGNEHLHEINNNNGVRVANFVTSKNLIITSAMITHRNIPTFTWTPPDGKTHNQINHILIERYETNPNIRLDRTWKITSNQYYQH